MATITSLKRKGVPGRFRATRQMGELADLLLWGKDIAEADGVTITRDIMLCKADGYRLANVIGLMLIAECGGFEQALQALCEIAPQCCGGGDDSSHAPDLYEAAASLLRTSSDVISNIYKLDNNAQWSLEHIEQAIRCGIVTHVQEVAH